MPYFMRLNSRFGQSIVQFDSSLDIFVLHVEDTLVNKSSQYHLQACSSCMRILADVQVVKYSFINFLTLISILRTALGINSHHQTGCFIIYFNLMLIISSFSFHSLQNGNFASQQSILQRARHLLDFLLCFPLSEEKVLI